MLRRYEFVDNGTEPAAGDERPARADALASQDAGAGDLGGLLDTRPVFGTRVHGYDRRQVDEYVGWAEDELVTLRQAHEQLLARSAESAAELAELRRRPVAAPSSPELTVMSERVRNILLLASDEAAAITAAATEEAARIVGEAQAEAEARLEKTAPLREASTAMLEQLRHGVARQQAESAALLEQARHEADELLRSAAAERDRLAAEAAERLARDELQARQQRDAAAAVAAGRLLAAKDEIEDLRRRRNQAQHELRGLAEQVDRALTALGAVESDVPAAREVPTAREVPATPEVRAAREVPVARELSAEAEAPTERVVRGVPEPVAS